MTPDQVAEQRDATYEHGSGGDGVDDTWSDGVATASVSTERALIVAHAGSMTAMDAPIGTSVRRV